MRTLEKLIVLIIIGAVALIFFSAYLLFIPDTSSADSTISVAVLIVAGIILIPAINAYKNDRNEVLNKLLRNAELNIENLKSDIRIEQRKYDGAVNAYHDGVKELRGQIVKLEEEKKTLLEKSRTVCIHCHQPMFF